MAPLRRRRVWMILVLGTGIPSVLAACWVWKLFRDADETLYRRLRENERLLAARRAADPARPTLLGEPEPGDAWECYDLAARTLDAVITGKGEYDITDEGEPGIPLLRMGASRREFRYEPASEGMRSASLSSLLSATCDRAARLHQQGRDADALERIRIVLAVIRDLELHGRHPRDLAGIERSPTRQRFSS